MEKWIHEMFIKSYVPGTVPGSQQDRWTSTFSSRLHLSGGNRHKLISEQITGKGEGMGFALTKEARSWNWGWESLSSRHGAVQGKGATRDNADILSEDKKQRIDAS